MSFSTKRLSLLAVSAGLLLTGLAATDASAASCTGSCGSLGANGDVTAPPNGSTYGWVSTFGGVDGVGQLPGVGGTDGSTFTTTAFAASAGDDLQYYFNFVTSDGQDGPGQFIFEDYAFVQLVDAVSGNPVAELFNARTEPGGLIVPGTNLPPIDPGVTLNPPTVGITAGASNWAPLGSFSGQCWGGVGNGCGNTGWIKSNYVVNTAGSYKLIFGVSNWGDTVYDTGLAFNGLQIGGTPIDDSVPEPATWAMLLVGFGGLGASIRSSRRKRAAGSAA